MIIEIIIFMSLVVFLLFIFAKIMVKIFSKLGFSPVNIGVGTSAFCMAMASTSNSDSENIFVIFLFAFIVSMFSGKIVANLAKRKGYDMVNAGIIGAFFPIFSWVIYKLLIYKNGEKTLNTDQYIAENWLALMFAITIVVAILFMSAWRFFI